MKSSNIGNTCKVLATCTDFFEISFSKIEYRQKRCLVNRALQHEI